MAKNTVLKIDGKFEVADSTISTTANVKVLSGTVQLAEGVTAIGSDGPQWGPIVVGLAVAATLSDVPPKFQAHNMGMIYAIMDSIPERTLVTLELTSEGYCENVYKVTRPDGWVEFMDAENQPGRHNYLKPKNGVPEEGSIDALYVKSKEQDESNGVTLPPMALLSRDAKNVVYNGGPESTAARASFPKSSWNWLPSSPGTYNARGFYSGTGSELYRNRRLDGRARLSRSFPPSPQGVALVI